MMVTVFRVETAEGFGPYSARSNPREFTPEAEGDLTNMSFRHTSDQHPTPCQSGIDFDYGHDRCGFPSLRALIDWFDPEERQMLHKHGFSISVYVKDIADVKFSEKQCALQISEPPYLRLSLIPEKDAP